MKVYGPYEKAPGWWFDSYNRWIATAYGWGLVKEMLRELAGNHCECEIVTGVPCKQYTLYGDAHHRFGRGGGRRDDRIFLPDGTRNLIYVSRLCHDKLHIERRYGRNDDEKEPRLAQR